MIFPLQSCHSNRYMTLLSLPCSTDCEFFFRDVVQYDIRGRHRPVWRSGLFHPAVEEPGHGSQHVRCADLPAVCVSVSHRLHPDKIKIVKYTGVARH